MKYYSEESIRLWQRDFDSSLDDYPCIEIKEPHGRLIDADTLMKKVRETADFPSYEWCKAIECLEEAPTVLEASK